MEEAYNINKTSWFVNPWLDLILLTGFPIVLVVIYMSNYLHLHSLTAFLFLNSILVTIFTLPHFFLTIGIVYLDKQESRGRAVKFLYVPILLFAAIIIFSIKNFNLITTILFYCIIWHVVIQNYYILQFHKLRNQDSLRFDNIIDNMALIIVPIYLLCKTLLYVKKFTLYGGIVYGISINSYILNYLRILAWFSIIVFIVRQVYLFIKWERINMFKISMIIMAALGSYYSLIMIKNINIFFLSIFRWHHTVQYILWVIFFHRQKFKAGVVREAKIISYLSQRGRVGLYILFFMLVSALAILFAKGLSSFTMNAEFTTNVMLAAIGFFHIYLDGFIWNISKVHSIINA